jgi:hypothetical protein
VRLVTVGTAFGTGASVGPRDRDTHLHPEGWVRDRMTRGISEGARRGFDGMTLGAPEGAAAGELE